jgi:lipopolysaccharide export system protein LptA
MSGKVILAQGPNILRGTSLVINLATGRADLTGAGAGGRVEGVFVPQKTPKVPSLVPGAAPSEKPATSSSESKPTP